MGIAIKIGGLAVGSSGSSWTSHFVILRSGNFWYKREINHAGGYFTLYYSDDSGVTWESLMTLDLTEDSVIIDLAHLYRHRIVDGEYRVDNILGGTGYAGTEGVDWENLYTARPWNPQDLGVKALFWGRVSEIAGGQMPNKVTGSVDYLTVAGSPATYQAPDTAPYKNADTDKIWFTTVDSTQRTVTTAELIGYDLQRTPVKYLDDAPNTIEEIIILKAGEVLTAEERDSLFKYMHLPILWDDSLNAYGHVKSNRIAQNLWPGIPIGLTLTLISGGVKLDWTDNSLGSGETEIWGQSDGAAYALLYTIAAGTVTKSEAVTPVDLRYYKLRTKKEGLYSDYSIEVSIAMLGAEKITNGSFSNSTGWTLPGDWIISGGTLNYNSATAWTSCFITANLVNGESYRLRFDLVSHASGRIGCTMGGDGDDQMTTIVDTGAATGEKTIFLPVRVGAGPYIYIQAYDIGFDGSIDNLSVKKVLFP